MSWRIDYLYDEEGRPYAGTYRSPADSTSPTFFVIITTDRGDVVELLDEDGDAFAAYRYDEWGNPIGTIDRHRRPTSPRQLAADIAERQILRYAGYAYDAESGLYYCSARHYDPYTRQFISKDPANADGEESAYQYCRGEPVGNTDPDGQRYLRHKHGQKHWKSRADRNSLKKCLKAVWKYGVKPAAEAAAIVLPVGRFAKGGVYAYKLGNYLNKAYKAGKAAHRGYRSVRTPKPRLRSRAPSKGRPKAPKNRASEEEGQAEEEQGSLG